MFKPQKWGFLLSPYKYTKTAEKRHQGDGNGQKKRFVQQDATNPITLRERRRNVGGVFATYMYLQQYPNRPHVRTS